MWLDLMLNILLSLNLWENAYCLHHGDDINQQNNQNNSVYFKEAVKTHKIYKKKCPELPLVSQTPFSEDKPFRIYLLWPQDILRAATALTSPVSFITSPPWMGPKPDTGLWCVTCRKMSELSLEWLCGSHAKGFLVRIS